MSLFLLLIGLKLKQAGNSFLKYQENLKNLGKSDNFFWEKVQKINFSGFIRLTETLKHST